MYAYEFLYLAPGEEAAADAAAARAVTVPGAVCPVAAEQASLGQPAVFSAWIVAHVSLQRTNLRMKQKLYWRVKG